MHVEYSRQNLHILFYRYHMKAYLPPLLFLVLLYWMGQNHWYTACLIVTAIVIFIYALMCKILTDNLSRTTREYSRHERAYHAAQILLGHIQNRVFWGYDVDFDNLLKLTNERMAGAEELHAYSFLQFDDGSTLPYWEPDDSERAKHIIKSLGNMAHVAEKLPNGEKYHQEILDLYHRLSDRFDKNAF